MPASEHSQVFFCAMSAILYTNVCWHCDQLMQHIERPEVLCSCEARARTMHACNVWRSAPPGNHAILYILETPLMRMNWTDLTLHCMHCAFVPLSIKLRLVNFLILSCRGIHSSTAHYQRSVSPMSAISHQITFNTWIISWFVRGWTVLGHSIADWHRPVRLCAVV